jgi:hypothetical protein
VSEGSSRKHPASHASTTMARRRMNDDRTPSRGSPSFDRRPRREAPLPDRAPTRPRRRADPNRHRCAFGRCRPRRRARAERCAIAVGGSPRDHSRAWRWRPTSPRRGGRDPSTAETMARTSGWLATRPDLHSFCSRCRPRTTPTKP